MRNIFTESIIPKEVYDKNEDEISSLVKEQKSKLKQLRDSELEQEEKDNLFRERLEIQEKLRDFIVQIPYYEYVQYDKNVYEVHEMVDISKYEHIKVMDCNYDIKGFYPLDYKDVGEDAMMF